MASGLPDYHRTVRPIYGAAQTAEIYGTAIAGVVSTLISKKGKGIIYGGFVALDYTSSQRESGVVLIIDASTIVGFPFEFLYKYKLNKPSSSLIYLLSYNDSLYKYSVGFSPGIIFDSSFEFGYYEQHDKTPDVWCSVNYALIT